MERLYYLANKIDSKLPQMADKLEKLAANRLDTYVPQNVLERGHQEFGGGGFDGQLGGYTTKLNISGNGNFSNEAINNASALVAELDAGLPAYEQWVQQHPNLTANPEEIYNILTLWQKPYWAGITDLAKLRQFLNMTGDVDLQFATTQPGSNFKYYGINSPEIMQHENVHVQGGTATEADLLQRVNQQADFLTTDGIGGGINPKYEKALQFIHSIPGPNEYKPNQHILERILQES